MKQIERLGPLEGLLKMMPGVNTKMLKQVKAADPKRMKHLEAIVLSMTLEERKKPELMNGSRRVARGEGLGRPISEVNRLLEQFREMQKMMKKAAGGAGRAAASSSRICSACGSSCELVAVESAGCVCSPSRRDVRRPGCGRRLAGARGARSSSEP